MVAHPDGVRIGKDEAEPSSHLAVVFYDRVHFPADVLPRRLDLGQHFAEDPVFERLIHVWVHEASISSNVLPFVSGMTSRVNGITGSTIAAKIQKV